MNLHLETCTWRPAPGNPKSLGNRLRDSPTYILAYSIFGVLVLTSLGTAGAHYLSVRGGGAEISIHHPKFG